MYRIVLYKNTNIPIGIFYYISIYSNDVTMSNQQSHGLCMQRAVIIDMTVQPNKVRCIKDADVTFLLSNENNNITQTYKADDC